MARKLKILIKEEEEEISNNDDNDIQINEQTPCHPKDRLARKLKKIIKKKRQ